MKKSLGLAIGAAALVAMPAFAQFSKVSDAIDYRQSVFVVMNHHFTLISRALKGEIAFNAQDVAGNASLVAALAKLPWDAFPVGSTSADSHAKPEIWKNAEKFKELQERLQAQTDKLAAIARDGDQAAIKSAFGDTAKTCKECHDGFRTKHT